jgi:hypothetical protein
MLQPVLKTLSPRTHDARRRAAALGSTAVQAYQDHQGGHSCELVDCTICTGAPHTTLLRQREEQAHGKQTCTMCGCLFLDGPSACICRKRTDSTAFPTPLALQTGRGLTYCLLALPKWRTTAAPAAVARQAQGIPRRISASTTPKPLCLIC